MLQFLNGRNNVNGIILHQVGSAAILGQYIASDVEGDIILRSVNNFTFTQEEKGGGKKEKKES